jgi:hypothetical protein
VVFGHFLLCKAKKTKEIRKMARFPEKENDIIALAAAMTLGFTQNPGVYPNPPVDTNLLQVYQNNINVAVGAVQAAEAALSAAHQQKDTAFGDLIPAMKQDLTWAEAVTNNDNAKLELIGWGARKQATPSTPPGQPRYFEAVHHGQGTVYFDWKAAATGDGGLLKSYCIESRELPNGPWKECGSTTAREKTLDNLPRGIELEFRVCGLNAAGNGAPSNTVTMVL